MSHKKDTWTADDVKCPFFLSEDRAVRAIRCEGPLDGVSLTVNFGRLPDREKHMGKFCCKLSGYEKCVFYRLTAQKYQ